jgi:hypothetical protein
VGGGVKWEEEAKKIKNKKIYGENFITQKNVFHIDWVVVLEAIEHSR